LWATALFDLGRKTYKERKRTNFNTQDGARAGVPIAPIAM